MAKNKRDACMFCGELPCICNAKPAKQPRAKKSEPEQDLTDMRPEPVARGSRLARMKDAARSAPPAPIYEPPAARRSRPSPFDTGPKDYARMKAAATALDEDSVVLNAAIRVLHDAGLLGESELQTHSAALAEPGLQEQTVLWRARTRYEHSE